MAMDVSNSAVSSRKRRHSLFLFEDLPEALSDESSSPELYQSDSPLPELVIKTYPPTVHDDSKEYYGRLIKRFRRMYYRDFLDEDYLSSSLSQESYSDNNNCEEEVNEDESSRISKQTMLLEETSPCNSPEIVRRQETRQPKASLERIITSGDQLEIIDKSRNTQNLLLTSIPKRSLCISLSHDQTSPVQITISRAHDALPRRSSDARDASSQTSLSSVHQTDSRRSSCITRDAPPQISSSNIPDASRSRYSVGRDTSSQISLSSVHQTASRISSCLSHGLDTPLQFSSSSNQKASPRRSSVARDASSQISLSIVHQTDSRRASCIALDIPPQISSSNIQDALPWRYSVGRDASSQISLSSVHQTDSWGASCIALDIPPQISASNIQDALPWRYSVDRDASSQISLSSVHETDSRRSSCIAQDTSFQISSSSIQDTSPWRSSIARNPHSQKLIVSGQDSPVTQDTFDHRLNDQQAFVSRLPSIIEATALTLYNQDESYRRTTLITPPRQELLISHQDILPNRSPSITLDTPRQTSLRKTSSTNKYTTRQTSLMDVQNTPLRRSLPFTQGTSCRRSLINDQDVPARKSPTITQHTPCQRSFLSDQDIILQRSEDESYRRTTLVSPPRHELFISLEDILPTRSPSVTQNTPSQRPFISDQDVFLQRSQDESYRRTTLITPPRQELLIGHEDILPSRSPSITLDTPRQTSLSKTSSTNKYTPRQTSLIDIQNTPLRRSLPFTQGTSCRRSLISDQDVPARKSPTITQDTPCQRSFLSDQDVILQRSEDESCGRTTLVTPPRHEFLISHQDILPSRSPSVTQNTPCQRPFISDQDVFLQRSQDESYRRTKLITPPRQELLIVHEDILPSRSQSVIQYTPRQTSLRKLSSASQYTPRQTSLIDIQNTPLRRSLPFAQGTSRRRSLISDQDVSARESSPIFLQRSSSLAHDTSRQRSLSSDQSVRDAEASPTPCTNMIDASTQLSLSDDEPDYEGVWRNFFKSTPYAEDFK